jgi:hypothetical protein
LSVFQLLGAVAVGADGGALAADAGRVDAACSAITRSRSSWSVQR